jgi:hypothetical protein
MDVATSFWFQVLKNVSNSLKAELWSAIRLEVPVFNYSVGAAASNMDLIWERNFLQQW